MRLEVVVFDEYPSEANLLVDVIACGYVLRWSITRTKMEIVHNKDYSIIRNSQFYTHSSLFNLHQISMSINLD